MPVEWVSNGSGLKKKKKYKFGGRKFMATNNLTYGEIDGSEIEIFRLCGARK